MKAVEGRAGREGWSHLKAHPVLPRRCWVISCPQGGLRRHVSLLSPSHRSGALLETAVRAYGRHHRMQPQWGWSVRLPWLVLPRANSPAERRRVDSKVVGKACRLAVGMGDSVLEKALAVDETVQTEECFYWSSRKRIRVTRIHISRGCPSASGCRSVTKTPAEPNIYSLVSWFLGRSPTAAIEGEPD